MLNIQAIGTHNYHCAVKS